MHFARIATIVPKFESIVASAASFHFLLRLLSFLNGPVFIFLYFLRKVNKSKFLPSPFLVNRRRPSPFH